MAAKTPTAQGVSAALRKAGFERSETRRSVIEGLREGTQGFRVRGRGDGKEVRVEYCAGISRGANAEQWRNEKLKQYAETLRAKGWNVQWTSAGVPCLLVTMKVED